MPAPNSAAYGSDWNPSEVFFSFRTFLLPLARFPVRQTTLSTAILLRVPSGRAVPRRTTGGSLDSPLRFARNRRAPILATSAFLLTLMCMAASPGLIGTQSQPPDPAGRTKLVSYRSLPATPKRYRSPKSWQASARPSAANDSRPHTESRRTPERYRPPFARGLAHLFLTCFLSFGFNALYSS